MKKKVLIIIAVVLVAVLALVGCESYKNAKFDVGDASAAVESNGGSIVKQGEYLYFINGYADYQSKAQDNWFGNVVKGAIMRIKESDLGDMSKAETIVPKTVVSSADNTGFSIYNGYIYYVSPSTEEDRSGAVKKDNLQFLRTGLDGQNTQVILEIEDGTKTQYKYTSKGLVYVKDSKLYFKSTAAKKFNKKKDGELVAEKVTAHMPVNRSYNGSATTDDVVFYTVTNEGNTYSDYTQTLYAYMPGETPVKVIGKDSYPVPNDDAALRYKYQFSFSILASATETVDGKDCVTLAYTKSYYADTSSTGTTAGTFMYCFDSTFAFDPSKERQISAEALSSLTVVSMAKGVISTSSTMTLYAYDYARNQAALPVVFEDEKGSISSATVVGTEGDYVFYLYSNKLYSYKMDKSSYVNIIGSTEISSDFIKPELLRFNDALQVVFFSNGTKCLYRYELKSMKGNAELDSTLLGVQIAADKESSSK